MSTDLVQAQMTPMEDKPLSLVERAFNAGATFEQMAQFLEMQERLDAKAAEKAFNVAFADFKKEGVTVVRNIVVSDGPLKGKKYADLFGVVSVVTPLMSKHGLSHAWKLTKDEPTWMEVTCTIRHVLGHSESVSMGACPDTGPGRNAIQARGSAKSYLERYTLLAATGLASTDTDDDGNATGPQKKRVEGPRLDELVAHIEGQKTVAGVVSSFQESYREVNALGDEAAIRTLKAAKDKRKAELA